MNGNHWTNDEVVDHLYGVGPEDGHERECAQCRARIVELRARREAVASGDEVTAGFLRNQRLAIAGRIEARRMELQAWWRMPVWVAVMAALALVLSAPRPAREATMAGGLNRAQDAEMYLEIYQSISSEEPRALAPMHGLFEEQ